MGPQTFLSLLLLLGCVCALPPLDSAGREPLGPHDDNARFDMEDENHWAWLFKQSAHGFRTEFVGDLLDIVDAFKEWATRNKREYMVRDTPHRFRTFKTNHHHVTHHNSRTGISYTLKMNEFADMTNEEFRKRGYVSQTGYKRARQANYGSFLTPWVDLPKRVDWRENGAVTPVKNQGQCGSCWAFSTTGAIEGAVKIKSGKLRSLSEQELMDCSKDEGNESCNGGLMDFAFDWVIKHGGIANEKCYPYDMEDHDYCNLKNCSDVSKITSYKDITENNEKEMLAALAQQPVSVAIEADSLDFQLYNSGVYDSNCGTDLDHGVLAVGYGTENGKDFFLVKNSWGSRWGDSGYIKMIRGDKSINDGAGQCGILLSASVPVA